MIEHIIPMTLSSRTESRATTDDPDQLGCQTCGSDLEWHQPDIDDPSRLLGICSECRGWLIMDLPRGSRPIVLRLIPRRRGKQDRGHDPAPGVPPDRCSQRKSAQRH